jgi:probable rRNA maturation factor
MRKANRSEITVVRSSPGIRFASEEVVQSAERVFRGEGETCRIVTVVLTTSRFIQRMNKAFLAHDVPTDVIAFPLHDEDGTPDEVYINVEYARVQAKEYHVTFREEMRRLIIHGCLHLSGFRDHTASAKTRMRNREDHYLRILARERK